MQTLRNTAVLVAAFAIQTHALAAGQHAVSGKREDRCVEQIDGRTAAIVARDWVQLEKVSARFAEQCADVFGIEELSRAHEDVATARNRLGNSRRALLAINACHATYYANTGCHVEKVEALLALKRQREAESAFDKAERLISHATESIGRDLQQTLPGAKKEYLEAQLRKLQAQRAQLDSLRELHFEK
jgi:hypothetical protein